MNHIFRKIAALLNKIVRKFIPQQPSSILKIEASIDKKIGLVNC